MFTILNRLRGTDGLWSKIIGLLLVLATLIAFNNTYVALAVGLGYIIGESFGWGEWVGTLSVHQEPLQNILETTEGKSNGIRWLASKIIDPTKNWLNYCIVALILRGFYWWTPTIAPLYFVGYSWEYLLASIIVLSVSFPVACELGYYFSDRISFEKFGLSYAGGWELQEGFYGLFQDLVFLGLILYII